MCLSTLLERRPICMLTFPAAFRPLSIHFRLTGRHTVNVNSFAPDSHLSFKTPREGYTEEKLDQYHTHSPVLLAPLPALCLRAGVCSWECPFSLFFHHRPFLRRLYCAPTKSSSHLELSLLTYKLPREAAHFPILSL